MNSITQAELPTSSNSGRKPWPALLLAITIFIAALLPRTMNVDVFVGPDEFSWVKRSANFAQALASGNWVDTYQTGHPGVTLMWAEAIGTFMRAAAGTDWSVALGADNSMATLGIKRQIIGVTNALLLAAGALLVRRIFGGGVAWLFGLLLALAPFPLTEFRALRTEGIFTGFSALTLLGLLLYANKPRWGLAALAGALTGLALLSKASGAALLPLGGLVIGGRALLQAERRLNWRGAITHLLAWGAAIALTITLLWPALWASPQMVWQEMYNYVAARAVEGGVGGHSFLLGQEVSNEALGPVFYPLVLLYRTSPALWLGLLLLALTGWRRGSLARRHWLSLAIVLLYVLLYLALITFSSLKYDRYTIPLFPALYLLAAVGFVSVWRRFTDQRPKAAQFGWLAAVVLLAAQTALALPHHPYYYTYWNPVLGGIQQAAQTLPIGTGSEGIDQLADYLNAQPEPENIVLASATSQRIAPLFPGRIIPMSNLDGRWTRADLVMIYISQLQRGKHAPDILAYLRRNDPLDTVTLRGQEYAWIYPGPAMQYHVDSPKLEGRGDLWGYSIKEQNLQAGDTLALELLWRNEGKLPTDQFWIRLVDSDGYVWAAESVKPRPGFETVFDTEGIVEGEAQLPLPIGMLAGQYTLQMGYQDTAAGQLIGIYELPEDGDDVNVSLPEAYPTQSVPPGNPLNLLLKDALNLQSYTLSAETVQPGDAIWLTLFWQAVQDVENDYVIALQLLDENDEEATFWLGRPARSSIPTNVWRQNKLVQDPWLLAIPPELQAGNYTLLASIYDAASADLVASVTIQEISVSNGE